MLKRFALGLALAIISIGLIFIGLNILDISEGYRLYLPIPLIDTVFIGTIAILVAYIAAKSFMFCGSFEIWGLGCAVLAFGFGSLLYSLFYWWLADAGINVRITANDSGVLIASIMHLFGAGLGMAERRHLKSGPGLKREIVFLSYLGILAIIAFVTWLALRGVITLFLIPLTETPPTGIITVRDVIKGVAFIFCVASALVYLRLYFKSRLNFYYWYSLGLILFAFGVIFISQGALESRLAWLGRVSQFSGGIYFLVSVLSDNRRARVGAIE